MILVVSVNEFVVVITVMCIVVCLEGTSAMFIKISNL